MTGHIKVKIYEQIKANNDDELDKFIIDSNTSTLYHQINWSYVIEKTFGHNSYYLYAENSNGNLEGALPIVHIRSVIFGNFLVSLPFTSYGGICAANEEAEDLLISRAIKIAIKLNADFIEFRDEKPLNQGFPVKTTKVSMRLELPGSADELWKSFPSKLRAQVRKPKKEGMYCKIGKKDELESFYRVFSINMRDLGTPVYPMSFFENILDYFPENSWICTVYRGNLPMASGFLLGFKNKLEIPWGSAIRQYNRLAPNMLLYWNCLKFACEKGYRVFDFGRSTPGEGTYKFKQQWGAKPHQLYWNYWLRDGGVLPDLSPKNKKYLLAIKTWKKLPITITKMLGPKIAKYFP